MLFPFYRAALSHYVDITALPRTHVLKEIAAYTTDENEKEMLNLMTTNSDEGRNKYNEFISNACRHITHILEDLPSCKPAIDHLLELLPRLQPRFYSISSSGKVHKDSVHVTAVVIGIIQFFSVCVIPRNFLVEIYLFFFFIRI